MVPRTQFWLITTAQELARREPEKIISTVPWSCRASDNDWPLEAGRNSRLQEGNSVNSAFNTARGTSVILLLSVLVLKSEWKVKYITVWGCLTTSSKMSVNFQEILRTFFLWKTNFLWFCHFVQGFNFPFCRPR